jgi:hypothetical protein
LVTSVPPLAVEQKEDDEDDEEAMNYNSMIAQLMNNR